MPSIADRTKAFHDSCKFGKEPFDVWPNDVDSMPPFPFPTLSFDEVADARLHGWKLVDTFNVDGNGLNDEELKAKLKVGRGYAYLTEGVIGEFELIGESNSELWQRFKKLND